jgi:hypothetical protein
VFLYTIKEEGGKPDRKPHPLSYGLRKPYRNLKSENSQDYVEKPQRNFTFILCTVFLACGLVVLLIAIW